MSIKRHRLRVMRPAGGVFYGSCGWEISSAARNLWVLCVRGRVLYNAYFARMALAAVSASSALTMRPILVSEVEMRLG